MTSAPARSPRKRRCSPRTAASTSPRPVPPVAVPACRMHSPWLVGELYTKARRRPAAVPAAIPTRRRRRPWRALGGPADQCHSPGRPPAPAKPAEAATGPPRAAQKASQWTARTSPLLRPATRSVTAKCRRDARPPQFLRPAVVSRTRAACAAGGQLKNVCRRQVRGASHGPSPPEGISNDAFNDVHVAYRGALLVRAGGLSAACACPRGLRARPGKLGVSRTVAIDTSRVRGSASSTRVTACWPTARSC